MGPLAGVLTLLYTIWNLLVWAWGLVTAAVGSVLPAPVIAVFVKLWAVGLTLGLLVTAAALNLAGVDSVHDTLRGWLDPGVDVPGQPAEDAPAETEVPEVSTESVTDETGQFSKSAFRKATGLTPPEFIHLVVLAHGGRVKQSTITAVLPWSKSTASRYLDDLEATGEVTRVEMGRHKVVCTPEMAGGDESAAA